MENWTYNGKPVINIDDLPNHETLVGFVYCITHIKTGKFYIGKKSLHSSRKTKISQKEKKETGTRKKSKQVIKESDWKTYWGSCTELKEDIKKLGAQAFKREIIELCCSKKFLTYCEVSHQVKHDVLTSNSYNGNILSRYFKKDMTNCN